MAIWYAIGYDGNLYNLCDCGDIEAAEESAKDVIPEVDDEGRVTGSKAFWFLDEHTAHVWANVILKGNSMNAKLQVSDVQIPSGSEESENEEDTLYLRVNDSVDIRVRVEGDLIVTNFFGVPGNDEEEACLDPLYTVEL